MLVTPDILRHLRSVIEPTVARVGYDLVAVELVGGYSGRPVLRVSIDREGGVGIHDCAVVSRELSPSLDVDDPIASAYELEVSTPGIERPVQRESDFIRFIGCEIRVKPFGVDGKKRTRGTLIGVAEGQVTVRVAGSNPPQERRFPLITIERASLALTLDQFSRLGKGLSPIVKESP